MNLYDYQSGYQDYEHNGFFFVVTLRELQPNRRMRVSRNCRAGVFRGCNTKQPCFYKDYDYDGFFIVVTLHEK